MSHFAQVIDGVVTQVLVAEQDFIDTLDDKERWIQTSYNTRGGIHYGLDGQPDGKEALRKNYAGIGYTYDQELDAFIPPKPYDSWTLDINTCHWLPPIMPPEDGNAYDWDELSKQWVPI